jgi:putative transcriptional regulator
VSDEEHASFKGRLIVASPPLDDENFRRTVVLMLEHGPEGALGVVLNRPTDVRAGDALPDYSAALPDDAFIHIGGPVEPTSFIILGDFVDPAAAAAITFSSVGVVDPDNASGELRAVRAFGGYAGWSAGQLEEEFADEAWIEAEALPADVFTNEPERLWSRVLDRKGGAYRLVARMPEDPSLN